MSFLRMLNVCPLSPGSIPYAKYAKINFYFNMQIRFLNLAITPNITRNEEQEFFDLRWSLSLDGQLDRLMSLLLTLSKYQSKLRASTIQEGVFIRPLGTEGI